MLSLKEPRKAPKFPLLAQGPHRPYRKCVLKSQARAAFREGKWLASELCRRETPPHHRPHDDAPLSCSVNLVLFSGSLKIGTSSTTLKLVTVLLIDVATVLLGLCTETQKPDS